MFGQISKKGAWLETTENCMRTQQKRNTKKLMQGWIDRKSYQVNF